ncbi:MAG: DJ-1 family glyoxalase III [Spirochaetia bacterium]
MTDLSIAILLADGFEEVEALTPADFLRRANLPVTTVSTNGKKFVTGSHDIKIEADILLADVFESSFSAVIIPGGLPGSVNLGENKEVIKFLHHQREKSAYLAAICAAPYYVLGMHGFLEGHQYTCNPGFQAKAQELLGRPVTSGGVVIDKKIITSQAAGTSAEFTHAIIACLASNTLADQVMGQSLFQF